MMFDMPGRVALSQGQFLDANRYSGMTQSGEFSEVVPHDYPELDEAIEWANDPDVTNEELQGYLADVAGEDNRDRKRATNVAKIVEYVESQQ